MSIIVEHIAWFGMLSNHNMVLSGSAVSEVQRRSLGLPRMSGEPGECLSAQGHALGRGQSCRIEAMATMQPRELLQGLARVPLETRLHPI